MINMIKSQILKLKRRCHGDGTILFPALLSITVMYI